jgi:hypothetical protein
VDRGGELEVGAVCVLQRKVELREFKSAISNLKFEIADLKFPVH